jgi:predicted enzyme related to lactoylglutathione lyase
MTFVVSFRVQNNLKRYVGPAPARSSSARTRKKEPFMPKMIFVNLPVTDLARATAFYQAIGAAKNPQFSDDTASCMVFSETIYAMLRRRTTTAGCTAAALRIRTVTCGE